MRTHFLSFGNGLKFFGPRMRVAAEARRLKVFDEVHVADNSDLGADFWEERGGLVERYTRGYGLWSWKPYAILRRLESMDDGDLLMYADEGCSLNHEGVPRLMEYLDRARTGRGWLGFSIPDHPEGRWTKRAMLRAHGQDNPQARARLQLASGIHFIRAGAETRHLASQWYEACGREAEMNDEVTADEHPEFIAHRHDQGAFSLAGHQRPSGKHSG
jgi:hypothetical protein